MRAWAKLLQGDPGYQDYIVVEPTTLDGEPGFILAAIEDLKNRIVVGSQPGSSLGSMFSMQKGTIVCIGEPGLTIPGESGADHSDLLLVRGHPTSLPLGTKWEYALVQLFGQEAVDAIVQRYDEESDEKTGG